MKNIQYILTEKCNMKCTYCNIDKMDKYEPSFDKFIKFKHLHLDNLLKYSITLFGGEPLLFTNLIIKIIDILSLDDRCKSIKISTNGSIFNDEVNYIINKPKVILSLSHDGINQLKNRSKLDIHIKELNINRVHCMITGDNILENSNILIDQYLYFKKLNIKCDMEIVRDVGSFNQHQAELFIKNYYDYIIYIINDININKIKSMSEFPSLFSKYFNQFIQGINGKYLGCQAGIKHFAFSEKENKVVSCLRFYRTNDENEYLSNFSKYIEKCKECSIVNMCGYGCPYEIIQNKGPIKELCNIYKGIFYSFKQLLQNDKKQYSKLLELYYKKEK